MAQQYAVVPALTSGVQHVAHGVHDGGEGAEEDDEGDDAGVEQGLGGQHVGQLRMASRVQVTSWRVSTG